MRAELQPSKWVEVANASTTAEQVDAAASELSRAGTGEEKANALRFDEPLHFVQQIRETLDLIDDDDRVGVRNLLRKSARMLTQG
jgi:hypothetical protein